MSRAVPLRLVAVAFSDKGTPSIQLGAIAWDKSIDRTVLTVATSREDVRRLVRALEALAVDLPAVSP